uniref:ATPase dynein-related AAA domain-containing protein n=1 Tax=Thermodesulfovibrio aggregans TaxID=86166 RepID=A0A7C4ELP8_9BACT
MQRKILKLYETIACNLYFGEEILYLNDSSYDPVILFGIFTLLLDGKELVFGGYGSGKTTSSERMASLVKGLPLEFVQATTIHGHPEQTEEKIKAVLDLGVLEREGKEIIRWKIIPYSPVVIIDEINRLPVGKQNIILNEVDRNIWSYRGETLIVKTPKAFFATINYHDTGTTKLIPPLCDRFDVAVETGSLHPLRKRVIRRGIDDSLLRESSLTEEMVKFILSHNHTEEVNAVTDFINKISKEFKKEMERRFKNHGIDLEIPEDEEVKEIKEEIAKIELSEDAELFLDYITQEVYCHYSTVKDFSRCHGCHYYNYICSDLYSISNRAEQSLLRYAKALAWLSKKDDVTLEHILTVIPYSLWHRVSISDKKISEVREIEKTTSDSFHALIELMTQARKRWDEHRDYQIELYFAFKEGDFKRVKEIAEKHHHPVFKAFLRGI